MSQCYLTPFLHACSKQNALCARNLPLASSDGGSSKTNSDSKGLERALSAMVIVLAAQAIDMQRDASALRETLQAVRDHLGRQVADLFALETEVHDAERPVRKVDHGAAESFVQRRVGGSEPC